MELRHQLNVTSDQLMDGFQAAEFFGVAPGTIRLWAHQGHFAPVIHGERGKNKRNLYWIKDLEAYKRIRDGEPEALVAA